MLMNKLCLTRTRTIAKTACDKNLVWINDKLAKASAEIHPGDTVRFQLYGFDHTIRIEPVPTGHVAKKDAGNYYTMLSREALPPAE